MVGQWFKRIQRMTKDIEVIDDNLEEEKAETHYPAYNEDEYEEIHHHTLTMIVRDRAGTLARVVGLFSARSYNIESISASNIDQENELSSITVITCGTEKVVKQIISQLERLVNIYSVTDVSASKDRVLRELALIKLKATGEKRLEALTIANSFHANIVDAAADTVIIEMTGAPRKVDTFIDVLRPLGVIGVVKSGPAGMINEASSPLEKIMNEERKAS